MYFALAGMMEVFDYLHYGLSVVLIFIGAKCWLRTISKIPTVWALAIVLLCVGQSSVVRLAC